LHLRRLTGALASTGATLGALSAFLRTVLLARHFNGHLPNFSLNFFILPSSIHILAAAEQHKRSYIALIVKNGSVRMDATDDVEASARNVT